MVIRWRFKAESFLRDKSFFLDAHIPFIGDYETAKSEAKKRVERWELSHHDTICRLDLRPDVPMDGLSRGLQKKRIKKT